MAVTGCRIQYASQTYDEDEKFRTTAPVEWLIETDSRLDGPRTIIPQAQSFGSEPLPRKYKPYAIGNDYDEFMLCKRISLRRVPNTDTMWLATATFDNTLDPDQGNDDPLRRAPIDEWDYEQYQRVAERDVRGIAVVNSAGQAYNPPLMADDSRPILTYTRNEAFYPSQVLEYQDAINSDQFLIFPPYTAKVNIRAMKMWENGVKFYQTKYTFQFRYDTWRPAILNMGTMFRPTAGASALPWPAGAPPRPLDSDGTALATDGSQEPTYKTHRIYREVPFAPLNIIIY